jgi:hypothetical protein
VVDSESTPIKSIFLRNAAAHLSKADLGGRNEQI